MIPIDEALTRLREGNDRYASGTSSLGSARLADRQLETASSQSPFAIVLGCSDSRVPPEVVFDQGIGDLFVVRIAGNVASDEAIGSVEFATSQLGSRVIVVLGHTGCGAVQAAVADESSGGTELPSHLRSVVDRILPAVQAEQRRRPDADEAQLTEAVVRANVRVARAGLLESPVIRKLSRDEALAIVCAEYDVATGRVEFFDADLDG